MLRPGGAVPDPLLIDYMYIYQCVQPLLHGKGSALLSMDGTGMRNWTMDLSEGFNCNHTLVQEYVQDPYSRFIRVIELTEPQVYYNNWYIYIYTGHAC